MTSGQDRGVRGEQPGPEALCQARVAVDRPQVEEDGGVQDRLRLRHLHPPREGALPGVEREAPAWVPGHHAAAAEREAAGGEPLVHRPREGQEPLPQLLRRVLLGLEHEPVVLVGHEGLLEPPLGPERDPAPGHRRRRVLLGGELEDPDGEQVVQRRDVVGEVLRGDAIAHEPVGHPAEVGGGVAQRPEIARPLQRVGHLHGARALEPEELVARDHADQPPLGVGHHHVPHAVPRHGERGVVGGGVRRERDETARHHRGDGLAEVDARERDPPQRLKTSAPLFR